MTEQFAVVVTGANGGIGRELLSAFQVIGFFTIGTDITPQECQCDAFVQFDLSKLLSDDFYINNFAALLRAAQEGRTTKILINNAAIQKLGSLKELSIEDFKLSIDVNLSSTLVLTKVFLNQLEKSNGTVINIGSVHSKLTKPQFISYATSKAALQGLTRALAVDSGERIRFNIIEPAATKTKMLKEGFIGDKKAYESLKKYHPMNRIADPKEIAAAAVFLASEECRFANGSVFSVDGGIGSRLHDPE